MNVANRIDRLIDPVYEASANVLITAAGGEPPSNFIRSGILAVTSIVLTGVAGWMSFHWRTAIPLIVVGVAWGVFAAYLFMKWLENKRGKQSFVSVLSGFVSIHDFVKIVRHADNSLSNLGAVINAAVTAVAKATVGTDLSQFPYFRNGVIWGTWLALLTLTLTVIINVVTTPVPEPHAAAAAP